jgi:hypothetical protein
VGHRVSDEHGGHSWANLIQRQIQLPRDGIPVVNQCVHRELGAAGDLSFRPRVRPRVVDVAGGEILCNADQVGNEIRDRPLGAGGDLPGEVLGDKIGGDLADAFSAAPVHTGCFVHHQILAGA